jgi:integrase
MTHDPDEADLAAADPQRHRHAQRGQIIRRGKNVYLLRVPLGRKADGRRRYLNETFHGSQQSAQTRLTVLLGRKDGGLVITPPKLTFEVYITKWLEMMRTQVGPHTHADYTNLMRRYVRPMLQDLQLAKITALDLDHLYATLVTQGLSVRTVRAVADGQLHLPIDDD